MHLLDKKDIHLTPIFVVASTGLQLILLLLSLMQTVQTGKIAFQGTPTLVELQDGSTARTAPSGHNERTPYAITNFVGRTVVGLMDWNGTLPPQNAEQAKNPLPDPGVAVGERQIATVARDAAFALSEDFRGSFLKELASLTPQDVFQQSGTQSSLIVRQISEPEAIGVGSGKWKVNLIANLIIFLNGDSVGKAIPFNKTIYVRAIDTPPLPPGALSLQLAAYRARRDCLEIYQIQDLNLSN